MWSAFPIDLGWLGTESAFASPFNTRQEYKQKLRDAMMARQDMIEADLALAAPPTLVTPC